MTTPKECRCNAETSTPQVMLPSAASLSKTEGHCLRERQRGGQSRSFVARNNEHKKVEPKRTISDPRKKQSRLRANMKSNETERRMAQWWTCTKQAALLHPISLKARASRTSQSACVRNCTRGLQKDWPRKAQRTVWLTVDCHGDIYLRPSQRFWRKSRRTTSQARNVEFKQHTTCLRSVTWKMGMPSWPRRRTGTPPVFLANTEGCWTM